MAAGWVGARCFCSCGPAGQGLVRGRPCGLRHNFFAPKTAPGKNFQKWFRRFSEVFQRHAGISQSRACTKHLNNSHSPEAFQSIFREFPRGHKSVFPGRNYPFPEEVRPSFLGIPVWPPMAFQCDFQWWPVCCHEWQTKCPHESLQRSASRTTELEFFGCEIARRVSKHTGLRFGCLVASVLGTSTILSGFVL